MSMSGRAARHHPDHTVVEFSLPLAEIDVEELFGA